MTSDEQHQLEHALALANAKVDAYRAFFEDLKDALFKIALLQREIENRAHGVPPT